MDVNSNGPEMKKERPALPEIIQLRGVPIPALTPAELRELEELEDEERYFRVFSQNAKSLPTSCDEVET